jgi:hypothetical protein
VAGRYDFDGSILIFSTFHEGLCTLILSCCNALCLSIKLAHFDSLDSLIEGSPVPTGTAFVLIAKGGYVYACFGAFDKLFGQLFTHEKFGHVGFRPGRSITGLGNVRITRGKDSADVLQLNSSLTCSAAITGEIDFVISASQHQFLIGCFKVFFLGNLIATSPIMSLHPYLLLLKVGDNILPHFHDMNCML